MPPILTNRGGEKIASCDKNRDQNQIFGSRLCALGSRKVEPVTLECINMGGGGRGAHKSLSLNFSLNKKYKGSVKTSAVIVSP